MAEPSATIRVTVALNSNQSRKAPLVLNEGHAPKTKSDLVFKTAQSKLRLKKPTRIFVEGGKELKPDAGSNDWKFGNETTLLVSAGEDYVGVKKASKEHAEANAECPILVLANDAPVESQAIAQLESTARTLPGIVYAVGQPDLHCGTKFPIGAVFVSRKWIHPPLIGGDIGCGMAWYKSTLSRSQVEGDKAKKVAEKLRGLEGPWRTQADRELWLRDTDSNSSAGEEWDQSLGTIGAGNHFAEIQVVEESAATDDERALRQDEVILLVHSGSRGYGGSILKKYTLNAHVSFQEGSEEAAEYLKEHNQACQWAKANRDLIALRFLSCLEPGESAWRIGSNGDNTDTDCHQALSAARAKLQERKVVDIWHNNVERVKWPPSPPSSNLTEGMSGLSINDEASQDYVYVHRKGAAPTYDPTTNTPMDRLPLPGSRGTPTMILAPTFSQATFWGLKNALSLAHGAGRSMSRAKALSSLRQKYKGHNLLEPTGSKEGTWVVCDEKDLMYEEAPDAYKDVHAVAEDLAREGVAEVVGWCRPRVSYKVRDEKC